MASSDKKSDDFSEIRDERQTAQGGSREGGARSQQQPERRDREQEDWKIHPHGDSPAEWDEEDKPNA